MTDERKNDGGSAFPTVNHTMHNVTPVDGGMTLRDWFAGLAMQGFLSDGTYVECNPNEIAIDSYRAADAMLKAREH